MAKKNGRTLVLKIDGVPVAAEQDVELSFSREMIDVTSKDSNSNRELIVGLKSWSVSCNALVDFLATHGAHTFSNALNNGTSLTVLITDGVTGQTEFTGSAYASEFTMNSTNEDAVTWSGSLEGTGALTIQTV